MSVADVRGAREKDRCEGSGETLVVSARHMRVAYCPRCQRACDVQPKATVEAWTATLPTHGRFR